MNFQILKFMLIILLLCTRPEPCVVLPHFPPVQNTVRTTYLPVPTFTCFATLCSIVLDSYSLKMSDSSQTIHCQGVEERATPDGALDSLSLDQKNTCTCAELKAKISKIPRAVLGVHVDASQ